MTSERGFNMIEILIVIVIIGISISVGVPVQRNAMEKSRAGEAVANLQSIWQAEHAYRVSNGSYYPANGSVSDLSALNSNLRLNLESQYYALDVTGGATTFAVTATRTALGGGDTTSKIILNQKGCYSGINSSYVPTNTQVCP